MSRPVTLVVVGALFAMGCVIPVFPNHEPPPNTPALVLGRGSTPQDGIVQVGNRDTLIANGQSEFTIEVRVVDPDVDQPLVGLVYVNADFSGESARPIPVIPQQTVPLNDGDDRTERLLEVAVPLTALPEGCHRVTFTVNEEYFGFPPAPPEPEVPDMVEEGRGSWLVAVTSNMLPMVDVTQCPGGMPEEM